MSLPHTTASPLSTATHIQPSTTSDIKVIPLSTCHSLLKRLSLLSPENARLISQYTTQPPTSPPTPAPGATPTSRPPTRCAPSHTQIPNPFLPLLDGLSDRISGCDGNFVPGGIHSALYSLEKKLAEEIAGARHRFPWRSSIILVNALEAVCEIMQMLVDDHELEVAWVMGWDKEPLELLGAAEEIWEQIDGTPGKKSACSVAVTQRYIRLSEQLVKAMRGERPGESDEEDCYDDQYDWDY